MDISDDFRPLQCLHSRRVYASHESLKYDESLQDGVNSARAVATSSAIFMFAVLIIIVSSL